MTERKACGVSLVLTTAGKEAREGGACPPWAFSFFAFHSTVAPVPWTWCHSHLGTVFPLLCSLQMPSKTSQEMCLNNFQVVLNPIKMTVETNHCNSHVPWKPQCPYLLDRKIGFLGATNKE